jgi:hypothetical protein
MKRLFTSAVALFLLAAGAQAQTLPHRKHTRPPYSGPRHPSKNANQPSQPKTQAKPGS